MTTATKKIQPGYKQTEVGVIPEDWEVKEIADVGEIKMCKRIFSDQTKETGIIPFYKIGTFGRIQDAFITQQLYDEYKQKYSFPKKGDILISASGTIGRTVVYDGKPAYFQDSNIIWINNYENLLSNRYLYYVYQIIDFNTEGGTIQRLYNDIFNRIKFPYPPSKSEQTAIATALSDMDALIATQEQLIAKKRAIKQGAMQELLEKKEGWEEKKLGEMLLYEQPTKYIVKSTEYNSNAGTPVLTAGKSFFLGYTNEKEGVFENSPVIIFDDFTTSIQFVDFRFKVKSSALKILKIRSSNFNLVYLYNAMKLIKFDPTDHKRYWISEYQNIEVPVPSVTEQTRIAHILSDMDAEIEQLGEELAKYRDMKKGMMEELLTGRKRLTF